MTPALVGQALRGWRNVICTYVTRLSALLALEESGAVSSTTSSPTLWLMVTATDLGVYCSRRPFERSATSAGRTGPSGGTQVAVSPQPHLRWCGLKARFIESIGAGLPRREGIVWMTIGRWIREGFPLHYRGPARTKRPSDVRTLQRASRTEDASLLPRLHAKISALLEEGGPMFGPYGHPPYSHGVVSPVLVVGKKNGDIRPVYHCSHPSVRGRPCRTRSLNGGIEKQSFWFPVYDSVASWLLQWYLVHRVSRTSVGDSNDWVVFKLDFESAFRQVPIRPVDWPLLTLYDSGRNAYLIETCAAFGTRISADLWLRVANIWKICLHAAGFPNVMIYVDDLAVICRARDVHRLSALVITLEEQLGTKIHWGKVFSDGGCTSIAAVLGVLVDVRRNVLGLDPTKARRRLAQLDDMASSASWRVKELESLVGALNFFATALPTGRLLLGPLYALLSAGDEAVTVGPRHAARHALGAWRDILARSLEGRFWQPLFFSSDKTVWVATDASNAGVGGCSQFGAWSAPIGDMATESINVRELVAVWISITQIWHRRLRGCFLHVFVDNETARTWAGHPPSSSIRQESWELVIRLQRSLALHLQELNCTLVVHRIPTRDNGVADQLSREPETPLGLDSVEAWKKEMMSHVLTDPEQLSAMRWLLSRDFETPLLWWRSKPTSLSPLVPTPIRAVLVPSDLSPSDIFERRPLLCALLQNMLDVDWRHHRVDGDRVRVWWKSIAGPQARSL